ncbi:hypothetical protein Lesp02_23500 [Lentzea sp. NBRC 105346]|uniref:tachylectin-related carbohydrate-binding protein n=1 Tax=Lentzea sp. NBRC 105346 TaxID=3032205 RepID=UPI0024A0267D|nr:tachylectin-related carbohydrate-binding protein [Lentzea sp. NBRC 105346]GLZ30160.1 hypothetical protein Lesp02_23500 [Lentzea sp. NBRC 105346]
MAGPSTTLTARYGLAPVYPCDAAGDLYLFEHEAPTNGAFTWGESYQIGGGWLGRVLAGPSGWMFGITTGGELRLLHYNGTRWDGFPGGGEYKVLGQGWSYTAANTRNRISVDEDGVLYTLDTSGNLKAHYYNFAKNQWAVQGALLDTGLTQYNAIVATSKGVVYMRTTAGAMFRYHIDFWSGTNPTWVRPVAQVTTGWQNLKNISSPGGEVFYAVDSSTGNLLWHSYNPVTKKWASTAGNVIGTGWNNEQDVVAQSNACSRFDWATACTSFGPRDGGAVVTRLNAVRKN